MKRVFAILLTIMIAANTLMAQQKFAYKKTGTDGVEYKIEQLEVRDSTIVVSLTMRNQSRESRRIDLRRAYMEEFYDAGEWSELEARVVAFSEMVDYEGALKIRGLAAGGTAKCKLAFRRESFPAATFIVPGVVEIANVSCEKTWQLARRGDRDVIEQEMQTITRNTYRILHYSNGDAGDHIFISVSDEKWPHRDTLIAEEQARYAQMRERLKDVEKVNYQNGYYQGTLKNNKPDGEGMYIWNNGNKYVGNWEAGKTKAPGYTVYRGGTKVLSFAAGASIVIGDEEVYNGGFNGKRNGTGVIWRNSGIGSWRIFYGKFKDDKRHGHGIEVAWDGTVKMGEWQEGVYQGHPEEITFSEYLRVPAVIPLTNISETYIKNNIKEWIKKGEFETSQEWERRTDSVQQIRRADSLYARLVEKYLEENAKKVYLKLHLGKFDADHKTFPVTDSLFGTMVIALNERITPQAFKESYDEVIAVPTYYYSGGTMKICEISFRLDGEEVATYRENNKLVYSPTKIDYGSVIVRHKSIESKAEESVLSSVDKDIPQTTERNKTLYALIIANEDYDAVDIPKVPYALNDGKVFRQYCVNTLGAKDERQIKYYPRATAQNIKDGVAWIERMTEAAGGNANVIVYYAGHAMPGGDGKEVYMMGRDVETPEGGYAISELYRQLGNMNARSVVCFIDACYEGVTRENESIFGSRGIGWSSAGDNLKPQGNVVVFRASSDKQAAYQYKEEGHGAFTYFLLKKLQESKGQVTLGELGEYVTREVKMLSAHKNRQQVPMIIPSEAIGQSWLTLRIGK